jgi:RNA polymerase sigma-70 factor, ECF subfamily
MRDLPDGQLMELYARGSEAAFEELFRRYEGRAYRYFLRRAACEAVARDLYQELFLRLHRFRDSYDPRLPFAPWFFQIARSVWIDGWRRQHRLDEVDLDQAGAASRDPSAEDRLAAREQAALALEGLSPEQARILVDAKAHGMEYGEIAAALSKSVDAVKQMASRSLRRLREAHAASR